MDTKLGLMKNFHEHIEHRKRLSDDNYMRIALEAASHARSNGDVPVAAVLVWGNGKYLVESDTRYTERNPLNHAVINLLNKAASVRIKDATVYTTLEPDLMCAMALKEAGVNVVVFGAYDDKDGFISSKLLKDHTVLGMTAIGGVLGKECVNSLPESIQEHVRHGE